MEDAVNPADAGSARRRRKLRWRRAKKDLNIADKKKEIASLHALVEPADLTLVGAAKEQAGRSVILT
jgi:hypothetical protein